MSEKILNDYLKEKDGEIKSIDELDSADVSVDTLNTILRKFYAEVRKADSTCYAKNSMITVRFGLQKHFLKRRYKFIVIINNIVDLIAFFTAKWCSLKQKSCTFTQRRLNVHRTIFKCVHCCSSSCSHHVNLC